MFLKLKKNQFSAGGAGGACGNCFFSLLGSSYQIHIYIVLYIKSICIYMYKIKQNTSFHLLIVVFVRKLYVN